MKRRAKIVCTLGPAADSPEALEAMMRAGMDVARLNFSHGSHEEHLVRLEAVRAAAERVGKPVAILQDLCGPKIRTGKLDSGKVQLKQGEEVELVEGARAAFPQVPVDFPGFADGLEVGAKLLIDDGRVTLQVIETNPKRVRCVAENAGELRDKVGVHLPARSLRSSSFTPKDKEDLLFGLKHGVDYVAVSFVLSANDMRAVREFCLARGKRVPLVSKIETPMAVEDLDAVVRESDAVMVARGDLGVEYPPEDVPVLQRKIIAKAHELRRPVIVATEMLQSMVVSKRPTRAEASDVAHAIFDGTDAVMLSGETAIGANPILSVEMMERILVEAERSMRPCARKAGKALSVQESIAWNAADIAEDVDGKALVAFTVSGDTARLVSMARPSVPIIVLTSSLETRRRMSLLWGVVAERIAELNHSDLMIDVANALLLKDNHVKRGDRFVVVFGAPPGSGNPTNSIGVRVSG